MFDLAVNQTQVHEAFTLEHLGVSNAPFLKESTAYHVGQRE